jgi:hypothetical protein
MGGAATNHLQVRRSKPVCKDYRGSHQHDRKKHHADTETQNITQCTESASWIPEDGSEQSKGREKSGSATIKSYAQDKKRNRQDFSSHPYHAGQHQERDQAAGYVKPAPFEALRKNQTIKIR